MSQLLQQRTIDIYGSIISREEPRLEYVKKWWYIHTIKTLINETWYGIAGEAVYNLLVPLWENGCDPWVNLLTEEALDLMEIDTENLSIVLIDIYRQCYTQHVLVRYLLPLGILEKTNTSPNYDVYTICLNDGLETVITLYIYKNLDCYKPSTAAEALIFSRRGWDTINRYNFAYSPVEITPVISTGTTNECATNSHRSTLNLLQTIQNKEMVVLPGAEAETLEDFLDAGWTAAGDSFIEFSQDFTSIQMVCTTCELEISGWFAKSKLGEDYYHPACVPIV